MFQIRPYQHDAVTAITRDLTEHRRVAAILPTGSGKTEIFVEVSRQFTEANPTKAILILSHLSLLTEQTKSRFTLRCPSLQVDIMQGGDKPKWNSSVVISTMQTSRNQKHIAWLKEHTIRDIGLIIIDEAHFLPVESYQTILSFFPEARVIGFTATPFRSKQVMTSCFDKVSYSISLQELIDTGYLVPPKLHQIVSKGETTSDVMATVLHLYKSREHQGQAIVYMQSVDDARTLRSAFDQAGIPAQAVTQELTGDYRTEILSKFNNREIRVLTTVNVLTAGFDSPVVDSIFMPYGTSSPTTYLQRIGRGLRPNPSTNKSHCDVYIFGDAPSVSRRVYEQLTNKILNAGGKPKSYATHREDLLYNDFTEHTDVYVWNTTVVEAITKMERLGMMQFAALLNEKRFPNR